MSKYIKTFNSLDAAKAANDLVSPNCTAVYSNGESKVIARATTRGAKFKILGDDLDHMAYAQDVAVINNLTHVTTSNPAVSTFVGDPYTATLSVEEGYSMETVEIRVAGIDVTADVYNAATKTINIANVTGIINVTAIAAAASTSNYLTFTANTAGSTVKMFKGENISSLDMHYSVDNGVTWTAWDLSDITLTNVGDKVQFKGVNPNGLSIGYQNQNDVVAFMATGNVSASGNVMSLIDGQENGTKVIPTDCCFAWLFAGCPATLTSVSTDLLPATTLTQGCYVQMFANCTGLTNAPALPATTLKFGCYYQMFTHCTSLTVAPVLSATTLATYCCGEMFKQCTNLTTIPSKMLPATTLADECYSGMFSYCNITTIAADAILAETLAPNSCTRMFGYNTNLVTVPDTLLPATTLADNCYEYLFDGCSSLTNAPVLPATTLAIHCYQYMFQGCSSLTNAPVLPATTLAENCYQYMFNGCSSLVNAPALPATTLATRCYLYMFENCTSLVNAPALPATTLADNCYNHMFYNCSSLVNTPELPATILVNGCYVDMFNSCTNLSSVKSLATTNTDKGYTQRWLNGVAANGTFIKAAGVTWLTGVDGIPTGWTVQEA